MINEDPYLDFVMKEASNLGKVFFIDSGEGNGIIDEETGWYIEDLSGWLINTGDRDNLLKSRDNETAYVDFSEFYVFAKWEKTSEGTLNIKFEKY